jgi:alkanesulfonate monooxygenase SsuD/methylene tetrahydromethanopterin reductase-like flavin-dependent oxidoreductase (luciferase family)
MRASRTPAFAKFREIATACGSKAGFIGTRKIILGKTDAEARALADEIMAKVDLGAVRGMRITSGAATEETVDAWMAEPNNVRESVLESALTGSPETVAREMAAWLLQTRVDGVCLSFFNYYSDLEVFCKKVLPLLADHLKGTGISISAPPEERIAPVVAA